MVLASWGLLFFRLSPCPSTPTAHMESPQGPHICTTTQLLQSPPHKLRHLKTQTCLGSKLNLHRWVSGFQSPTFPKGRLTLHPTSFIFQSTGCWRFLNPYRTEVFWGWFSLEKPAVSIQKPHSFSFFRREWLCYLAQKLKNSVFS